MVKRALALAVLLTTGGLVAAFAAEPAGTAVMVNQNAAAAGAAGSRPLISNGSVFTGDRITTDGRGLAQIRLNDDTRLIVGPNSNIAVDKFVVTGPANAQKVAINAATGAFRFITGNAPKSAYEIDTPVATIAVRGTVFDFAFGPQGIALLLYPDGRGAASSVTACDKAKPDRHCYVVAEACTMIIMPPIGDVRVIGNVYQRTQLAAQTFPFLDKFNILTDWRALSAQCEHYDPTDPSNTKVYPGDETIKPDPIEPPDCGYQNDAFNFEAVGAGSSGQSHGFAEIRQALPRLIQKVGCRD